MNAEKLLTYTGKHKLLTRTHLHFGACLSVGVCVRTVTRTLTLELHVAPASLCTHSLAGPAGRRLHARITCLSCGSALML